MRRLWTVVLVGAVALAFVQPVYSMRKFNTPTGAPGRVPPGMQLGKKQPGPGLTAAQQATIKRRIMTAMSGLDRIHVVGSKAAPIPPEALDALAEWRDQNAKDVEMWWDPDTRTPFFIKGNDLALQTSTPLARLGHDLHTAAALGTFRRLPEFLGLRDAESELRPLRQQTDDLGMTHARFQQTYRGHDVWARDLYCHFTPDSRMNLINGRWAPTPVQLDGINPVLNAPAAIEAVRAHFADRTQVETSDTTLVVYIDSDQTPHWAWMVRTSLGPTEGYDVFIDAVTGEHLHQVSFVYYDGPVVGSGVDLFGYVRPVNAYQQGSTYYMVNTAKAMFDPSTSILPFLGDGVIEVRNFGLLWNLLVTSANKDSWADAASVSASWHLGFVYDYFLSIHGRNGIDARGSTIRAIVNDPSQGNWTGNNAAWNPSTQTMYFGTGDGTSFSNMARALDVTAHEMGHGVVNNAAGLKYELQPGAINESFADVFGAMTEFFVYGGTGNWIIGEDILILSGPDCQWRNMANPTDGWPPQPATMSQYSYKAVTCSPDTCDHGGVHINSGIPNHAFYQIASSSGRGRADSIYYHALTTYLFSYSQFIDLRLAVAQAANDLYPGNITVANAISSAFDAVEIYAGPPTPPPVVQPAPTSAQWIVGRDEATHRLASFDTSGTSLGFVSTGAAATKPSVPDSGTVVYFIDTAGAVRRVNSDGSSEAVISSPGFYFADVAVSPDGSKLAYDIIGDPRLYILDLASPPAVSWPLYTPTYSRSDSTHDVLWADVLEWDIYGQHVMFDCFCALPRQSDTLYYWDIRTVDVATGRIQRTFPSVPVGTQVGNPSYGKIHPDLIVFDYFRNDDSVWVNVANLSTNKFGAVAGTGLSPGRPSLAPNDGRVIFEFNSGAGTNLWTIGLNPESLNTFGGFRLLVGQASFPNWRFTGRDTPVDVSDTQGGPAIPSAFSLYQNYPNPFNGSTVISYETRSVAPVTVEIFNILGQRVFARDQEVAEPGRHSFAWNGTDQSGTPVPSGLYLYRVTAGGAQQTRKMVLLK